MNVDHLDPNILSLVTFAPLAGALLLVLISAARSRHPHFRSVVSLLTFVLSLHLPVHFHRAQTAFNSKSTPRGSRAPTFTTTWGSTASRCG